MTRRKYQGVWRVEYEGVECVAKIVPFSNGGWAGYRIAIPGIGLLKVHGRSMITWVRAHSARRIHR